MRRARRFPLYLVLLFTLCFACGSVARAAEPVEVKLKSGRTFVGEVDARTDAERLWLRFGTETTVLLRPVAWDRIATARSGDRELSIDELRQHALSANPAEPVSAAPVLTPAAPTRTGTTPAADGPTHAQRAAAALAASPQVQSVALDAYVADGDEDVEIDGIVVHVYPLDAVGELVEVDGTVEVNLVAQRASGTKRDHAQPHIGRWVHAVEPHEIGPSGAVFKLPFRARHPDFDLKLAPYGFVEVRLAVPGQGTFDATLTDVRLRLYSATRDRLWELGGSRFLRGERLGRTN